MGLASPQCIAHCPMPQLTYVHSNHYHAVNLQSPIFCSYFPPPTRAVLPDGRAHVVGLLEPAQFVLLSLVAPPQRLHLPLLGGGRHRRREPAQRSITGRARPPVHVGALHTGARHAVRCGG